MKTGIELIAEERERQISQKGYNSQHDDEHGAGELAMAAMCYSMLPLWRPAEMAPLGWPWSNMEPLDGFKPSDNRIRELQKAGALIAAEIDRLQRVSNDPQYIECDLCDGCGWYEGGPTLETQCERCGGTGQVKK
jgi:hypothetical protein